MVAGLVAAHRQFARDRHPGPDLLLLAAWVTHCGRARLLRCPGLRPLRLARPAPVPKDRAAADLLPAAGAGPGAAALVQRRRRADVLAHGDRRPPGLDRAGGHAGDGDPGLRLRPGAGGGRVRSGGVAPAGAARGDPADPVARDLVGCPVRLPAVLGQFPAVALHHRRRFDRARMALRQDGGRLHADGADARHLHRAGRRGRAARRRRRPPPLRAH